jgi:hypothetical protein
MKIETSLRIVLLCSALLAFSTSTSILAHGVGGFDHETESGDELRKPLLLLNEGAKWQIDETVRLAMTNVRDTMAEAQQGIAQNTITAAEYNVLAGEVNQQISTIVGQSQLTREARENFYAILLDLVEGSDMMRQAGMQREGALKIITALQRYPEYFDHRNWTAVAQPAEPAQ